MPKENLNEFNKEELEGVILGSRTGYSDALKIYNTINRHYLIKEINVNFYVAKMIPKEYKVLPIKIDIIKYLQTLLGDMNLEEEQEENERKQRILDQLKCQQHIRRENDSSREI